MMQILNEISIQNPNCDTHLNECSSNHCHANDHWGDDHYYDTLDTQSQALWEYYIESRDEYWYHHCECGHYNQDDNHTNSNTMISQEVTESPALTSNVYGNILDNIRYVYADWLNDRQRQLARRYVEHTLLPTKPIIAHSYDLCRENQVSFDELASLSLGIRAYQNDVRCQCCGVTQMIYPKVAKLIWLDLETWVLKKTPYYVCAECNLFREVPF